MHAPCMLAARFISAMASLKGRYDWNNENNANTGINRDINRNTWSNGSNRSSKGHRKTISNRINRSIQSDRRNMENILLYGAGSLNDDFRKL